MFPLRCRIHVAARCKHFFQTLFRVIFYPAPRRASSEPRNILRYMWRKRRQNLAIPNAGRGRKGSRGERKDVWSGDISIWIGLFFFGLPPKRLLLQYEPNLK